MRRPARATDERQSRIAIGALGAAQRLRSDGGGTWCGECWSRACLASAAMDLALVSSDDLVGSSRSAFLSATGKVSRMESTSSRAAGRSMAASSTSCKL